MAVNKVCFQLLTSWSFLEINQTIKLSKTACTVNFGWVNICGYNFFICAQKFTNFFLFNSAGIALNEVCFLFSIYLLTLEIFAVNLKVRPVESHSGARGNNSRGAPKHFCGAPLGTKFWNYSFQNGAFWCIFVFLSEAGPPNVAGPGVPPYPTLSTGLLKVVTNCAKCWTFFAFPNFKGAVPPKCCI